MVVIYDLFSDPIRDCDTVSVLRGAVFDGALVQLDTQVAVAQDLLKDFDSRAQVLSLLVPDSIIISEETALWVHSAIGSPFPLQYKGNRIQFPFAANPSSINFLPDFQTHDGLQVSTPAQCILDCVRHGKIELAESGVSQLAVSICELTALLYAQPKVRGNTDVWKWLNSFTSRCVQQKTPHQSV